MKRYHKIKYFDNRDMMSCRYLTDIQNEVETYSITNIRSYYPIKYHNTLVWIMSNEN